MRNIVIITTDDFVIKLDKRVMFFYWRMIEYANKVSK